MIVLLGIPEIGTVVDLDGQSYEMRGTEPYTRKDGEQTTLIVWETVCPDCQSPFEVRSTVKSNGLTRRCKSCAKVGKPVKGRRGRKVRVKVTHA